MDQEVVLVDEIVLHQRLYKLPAPEDQNVLAGLLLPDGVGYHRIVEEAAVPSAQLHQQVHRYHQHVVAAIAVTDENWRVLETLGVQDSKNITDPRAAALSRDLQAFPHEVIVVMPKR